jgi:hypothetical protein
MSDQPSVTPRQCRHPRIYTNGSCTKCGVQTERTVEQLEQENATLRAERDELSRTIEDAHHTAMIDWPGSEVPLLGQVESLFSALKNHYNDKMATLRELAEGLANGLDMFRTQDAPKDALAVINDALRPYYNAYPDASGAAAYRAACPGEGQPISPSNSPTDSRDSHG